MDRLLHLLEHDQSFKHFLLDGQAIILEDYLEIFPDKSGLIRSLVREGKLSIGPWYILPDEFLVSGEAMVRNICIGHLVCEVYGGVQKIGYMPDSFGHFAQLPQLLRQAGIDSFVYTRGNGDEIDDMGAEYYWQAPDGSEVLAIQQLDGYCNAGGLGSVDPRDVYDEKPISMAVAVGQFGKLLEKMTRHANSDVYLFNNGCDHFPPQAELGNILSALREHYPDIEILHGSLADFLKKLRERLPALKHFREELRSGKYHHILSGVWSARIYLKQLNNRCEVQLSRYTEPAMSALHFIGESVYPAEVLNYCWKSLLKNHPHDSICGCSVDEVHREMIPRFEAVLQTCSVLLDSGFTALCKSPADERRTPGLILFNPLTYQRSVPVDRYCTLPAGTVIKHVKIIDERGRPVACRVVEILYSDDFWMKDFNRAHSIEEQSAELAIFKNNYPERFHRRQNKECTRIPVFRLQFMADNLPPCGIKYYQLIADDTVQSAPSQKEFVKITTNTLENRFYKIHVRPNGTFDLVDKLQKVTYNRLHIFEDSEDAGDEYDYAPATYSQSLTSEHVSGSVISDDITPLRGSITAQYDLPLPKALRRDRSKRLKRKINCRVETSITLEADSPVVRIRTKFRNGVRDHRLRVLFPTYIKNHEVVSDGHFYVNHRAVRINGGQNWIQAPTGTYPQQAFTLVEGDKRGFVVYNKGLPEFAPFVDDKGNITLAITLLRSVEWLSRDDLSSRKGNAGPMLHTPDAQCPGEHVFEYAVSTFHGNYIKADIARYADQYLTPVYIKLTYGLPVKLPETRSLLSVASTFSRLTALKKHDKRDTLICRIYNLTAHTITETLKSDLVICGVWQTDLLENRVRQLLSTDCKTFNIVLNAHEIITIEIEFTKGTD